MRVVIDNGDLYSGGQYHNLTIPSNASEIHVVAEGTGSCILVGKIRPTDAYKQIGVVRCKDYTLTDNIADNEIYIADITGFYSISVANVVGFTEVWGTITG